MNNHRARRCRNKRLRFPAQAICGIRVRVVVATFTVTRLAQDQRQELARTLVTSAATCRRPGTRSCQAFNTFSRSQSVAPRLTWAAVTVASEGLNRRRNVKSGERVTGCRGFRHLQQINTLIAAETYSPQQKSADCMYIDVAHPTLLANEL
jgi:hypothetical protein